MGREKCEKYQKNNRNLLLFGGGGGFPPLKALKKTHLVGRAETIEIC